MKTNDRHRIIVTVGTDGNPVCNPNPVQVTACDTHLRFELQAPDYVFPKSGAVTVVDGGEQFPPSVTLSDTEVKQMDGKLVDGQFTYWVKVVNIHTHEIRSHDPTIVNGDLRS